VAVDIQESDDHFAPDTSISDGFQKRLNVYDRSSIAAANLRGAKSASDASTRVGCVAAVGALHRNRALDRLKRVLARAGVLRRLGQASRLFTTTGATTDTVHGGVAPQRTHLNEHSPKRTVQRPYAAPC